MRRRRQSRRALAALLLPASDAQPMTGAAVAWAKDDLRARRPPHAEDRDSRRKRAQAGARVGRLLLVQRGRFASLNRDASFAG
jgi:hypothetical protein